MCAARSGMRRNVRTPISLARLADARGAAARERKTAVRLDTFGWIATADPRVLRGASASRHWAIANVGRSKGPPT
eukprot:6285623-Pyramimonas_sp.AAC.1